MTSAIEVTKKRLYTEAHSRYEIESIAIEDCRFLNFTEFLDEVDVFKNPKVSRSDGKFKNGRWSLLGYSAKSFRQTKDEAAEDEEQNSLNHNKAFDIKWEYTMFNGIFSDDFSVSRVRKTDIEKKINETVRFLEKTFSGEIINDTSEVNDLQKQLNNHDNNNNLERVDICIVTDMLIEQDNLPSKVKLKHIDHECRIYYWDLKRWNDIKRSKSKREPINIDFKHSDYEIYKVPYLKKDTPDDLTYYLSIFPGDLIADLYDLHSTKLLENNVRVFLSATMKANQAIRKTIRDDAFKFFSYNNGISATAEKIIVDHGKIMFIQDFQIVNGGQTTATIHYSRKKDKYKDKTPIKLDNIHVAVKITELKKDDKYSSIVSNISKAANTQSSIKNSDFYANDKNLILLEQQAQKNPIQNELDKNIYYFFERMKGQYKTSASSRGSDTQNKIWEDSHPKKLKFDKIELARWSNIMNGLAHTAALGGEKQFKDFIDDKNYIRDQVNNNQFKTLIGLGLMFKRIKMLCGSARGVAYPSLTIDPNTKEHVPVAMSTAIYTATYIHHITEGRLDYWAFYNYKHGLTRSVNSSASIRIESSLDQIFEQIILACWKQITIFGGAAAQEKTKKIECWNYVKDRISFPDKILNKLKSYTISQEEKEKREQVQSSNEDLKYFTSLNTLLANNGHLLSSLFEISTTNSEYLSEKATLSNLINRIKQENKILGAPRIQEVCNLHEQLKDKGFEFKGAFDGIYKPSINVQEVYESVFQNKVAFIENLYEFICGEEDSFEENEKLYNKAKDIIENYYIQYGLSIKNLRELQMILKLIGTGENLAKSAIPTFVAPPANEGMATEVSDGLAIRKAVHKLTGPKVIGKIVLPLENKKKKRE